MIAGYIAPDAGSSSASIFPEIAYVASASFSSIQSVDSGSLDSVLASQGIGTAETLTFEETTHLVRWSPYVESLFQELVGKRATRTISKVETKKLTWLRSERERLHSTLPANQILRDFKAGELRRKALGALSEYAQYLKETAGKS